MSEAMILRRGGAGLDFRVLGGTVEPAAPREKDIWVDTDQSVTGVLLSATQPEGSEGLVWVQLGRSSPVSFAADRRGTLMTYPERCFQYLSGVWTAKSAKSRLGGAWQDWRSYLFYEGDGPASAFRVTGHSSSDIVEGAVSATRIRISGTYNAGGERGLSSASAVDLSGFQCIYAELIANTANWTMGVALGQIIYNTTLVRSTSVSVRTDVRQTVSVDVSALTGSYYVGGKNGSDSTTNVVIYKIWGE